MLTTENHCLRASLHTPTAVGLFLRVTSRRLLHHLRRLTGPDFTAGVLLHRTLDATSTYQGDRRAEATIL